MTAATLTLIAIKGSLVLTVFVVGLRSRTGDVAYLPRHPSLWARSVLAMTVIMPLIVLGTAALLALPTAVEVGLFALSLAPIPPMLPRKATKLDADAAYMLSLFVLMSALSIILVPAEVALFARLFGASVTVSHSAIARLVGYGILLPLLVGAIVRRLAPSFASRAAAPLSAASVVVLVVGLLPVLLASWPAMRGLIGNGTVVVVAALAVAALLIGHWLGGPAAADRPVLALATASRHPAIGILIASAILPGNKVVPAAILLAVLVASLATLPYTAWQKRRSRIVGSRHTGADARARAPAG